MLLRKAPTVITIVALLMLFTALTSGTAMADATQAELLDALDADPTLNPTISTGGSDPLGFGILTAPNSGFPTAGDSFLVMSSGCVSNALQPNDAPNTSCGLDGLNNSADQDLVQLTFSVDVPTDAKSWSVNFKFLSEEFPEYVGSAFNDAFLIEQGESSFTIESETVTAPNNVAFDAAGERLSINTTGVLGMTAEDAAETTYDGATKTLTTEAPVPDGAESLTLVFSVMDIGDSAYDTTVFIDNFQFSDEQVDTPVTEPEPTCPGFEDDPRPQIVGTPDSDTLTGTSAAEVICGLTGNDTIRGGGGDDLVTGDAGNDVIRAQAGADTVMAGPGVDYVEGNDGPDMLSGGRDNDQLRGGNGDDTLRGGHGFDILAGEQGADAMDGGSERDKCLTDGSDPAPVSCP